MSFVAACGEWFYTRAKMHAHERSCRACADVIKQEDEDYREDYDDERPDMEED